MWWVVSGVFAVGVLVGVTVIAWWLRGAFRGFL